MFHGSMVALVTPMQQETDAVDYAALTKLIEWHISQGTDAIIAAGTTGEAATLSHAEIIAVTQHVVNVVADRVPVIAGSGTNATRSTIELTASVMAAGADAALIMTPSYNRPTQQGLVAHYRAVAEAVKLPIIMYNVPSRTGCDLLPDAVTQLAQLPNIIGLKEATGSIERTQTILNQCGDQLDIYSGDDKTAAALFMHGAKGVISVTANVVPGLMAQLCDAALAGDHDAAAQYDAQLKQLHDVLFVETNPIPVKWALAEMGLISRAIRLPLLPLSAAHHAVVREQLRALKLIATD